MGYETPVSPRNDTKCPTSTGHPCPTSVAPRLSPDPVLGRSPVKPTTVDDLDQPPLLQPSEGPVHTPPVTTGSTSQVCLGCPGRPIFLGIPPQQQPDGNLGPTQSGQREV